MSLVVKSTQSIRSVNYAIRTSIALYTVQHCIMSPIGKLWLKDVPFRMNREELIISKEILTEKRYLVP